MRKVHIDNEIWEYDVGVAFALITSPQGKKAYARIATIKGITPESFEKGRHKRSSDGSLTPSEIKSYIEKNKEIFNV